MVSIEVVFSIFSLYLGSTGRAALGWHCISEGSEIQDLMDRFQIVLHHRALCQVEQAQECTRLAEQQ